MAVLRDTPEGCRLEVSLQPKARRSAFAGLHGETVKIALEAPPVEGKANESLRRFLADFAGVALSAVTIVRGHKSRRKSLLFAHMKSKQLLEKLKEVGIEVPPELVA